MVEPVAEAMKVELGLIRYFGLSKDKRTAVEPTWSPCKASNSLPILVAEHKQRQKTTAVEPHSRV